MAAEEPIERVIGATLLHDLLEIDLGVTIDLSGPRGQVNSAHALGQLHSAFVEVGVRLGLAEFNRLWIGMRLCRVLLQIGGFLLHGAEFGALASTLITVRDGEEQRQKNRQRNPESHRSAASAAGVVTVSTWGLSSV